MTRDADLHHARVLLAQARVFRIRGSAFAFTLLEWAGNARRRAMLPASDNAGQMSLL